MRRAILLTTALGLACGACGDGGPAMPDTTKTVPVVPEYYERRDLDTWMGLDAHAPAEERAAQAFALAALEKEPIRAAPVLLRLLQDDNASVRLAAVIASGRLAPPSKRLAAVLVRLLASDDEPLRRHAREALGGFGAAAVEPLGGALAEETLRVRWGALYALARIGRPAEPLADAVAQRARQGEHDAERRQARFTLARLGPRGAEACAAFLASEDASERDEAASALAFSGADGVPPLLRLIQGEDELGAAVAAGVLEDIARRGPLGAQAQQAAAVLVGALAREGPVRFNAMDALMAMGAEARGAVEALGQTGSADLQQVAAVILEGIAEVEGAR